MVRIVIGGIATESCTFSTLPTRLDDFTLNRGDVFFNRYPFLNELDAEFVPLMWARALPGDWIMSIREVVSNDCLISASFDLHGNISPRVVEHLNAMSAFRTAPHVDVI